MSALAGQLNVARLKTIGLWALKLVLAALFLLAGGAKLAGVPAMVAVFDQVGLGQWFRYFTGMLEVVGALLLLWPVTTALGAVILMIVSIGAALAQLLVLHEDVIHAIVLAIPLAAIAWYHRDQLGGLDS
jgi:putative oxidoreductase